MKNKLLKRKYLLSTAAVTILILIQLIQSTQVQTKTLSASHIDSDSSANFASITGGSTLWNINYSASWSDLQTFLPSGKMSGTAVWVKLVPPSKSPLYSEPYRNDYIRWAQEIARLSLRYSNLKGYSIENLQDNINSGNLTQNYIENMKAAGLAINPKLQFIITDKTYKLFYVDKDAKGIGDGSSWENAATSVSALNWNVIQGGDTIYISGGTGSKTYYSSLKVKKSGTQSNKIIITRGKDEGHNGLPIFDCQNTYIQGNEYPLWVTESYLEFSYLSFRNGHYQTVEIDQVTDVDISNCEIIHPYSQGIKVYKSFNTRIMHNKITTGTTNVDAETDAIILAAANNVGSNCEIAYNTIIETNLNTEGHHQDLIQIYPTWGSTGVTKIHDNFLMQNPAHEASHTACVYATGSQGYYEIYNNIIILNNGHDGNVIGLNKWEGSKMYAKVFNNTLVASNSNVQVVHASNIDSLEYKNNIIYKPNGTSAIRLMGTTIRGFVNIDHNHYYISDTSSSLGSSFAVTFDGAENWIGLDEWKLLGYDANGTIGKITFLKLWGTNITDYRLIGSEYCIDAGTPIKILDTDILKIFRPQGFAWDIGALEQ